MEVVRIKSLSSIPNYENFQFDMKYGVSSQCYIQLLQAVDPYFNAVVLEESKTFEYNKEGLAKAADWIEEKRKNILKDLVGEASVDPNLKNQFSNQNPLKARYAVYSDTLCFMCKCNLGISVNMCGNCICEQGQNSYRDDTCNCMQIPAEGEKSCPYYIPCKLDRKEVEESLC